MLKNVTELLREVIKVRGGRDIKRMRRHTLKHAQAITKKASITLPKLTIQQTGENMKLYNCKSAEHPGAYIITKFDNHMEVESSYLVSNGECACPRGHAHSCRHRDMLHKFRQYKHIDDGWFLDWDTRIWHEIALTQTVDEEIQARDAHDTSLPDAPVEKEPETPVLEAPPMTHPVGVTTGATKLYRRLPR